MLKTVYLEKGSDSTARTGGNWIIYTDGSGSWYSWYEEYHDFSSPNDYTRSGDLTPEQIARYCEAADVPVPDESIKLEGHQKALQEKAAEKERKLQARIVWEQQVRAELVKISASTDQRIRVYLKSDPSDNNARPVYGTIYVKPSKYGSGFYYTFRASTVLSSSLPKKYYNSLKALIFDIECQLFDTNMEVFDFT